MSGRFEKQDFARLEAQQQEEKEGARETSTLGQYSHPAEQSNRAAPRGPNRDLTREEDKHVVDPRGSVSAESSRSTVPDVETPLIKTLDLELSLTNTGVKDLCGAAADWRGESVSTPVKLEAEASLSDAFRTHNASVSVTRIEYVSNSSLTTIHHTE